MSPSGRLEQLRVLARLRKVLAGRERLDRAGDEARAAWCAARLAELRRHAVARSPLYREAHRNLETAPLDEMPTITKADVVERFAELVTDRRLRPEHLRHVIDDPDGTHRALGRYRVAWGREPFDQYLTTEAGFVAMECGAHDGLHVLDDHVVVEVVDRAGAPVAPGVRGGRVLLTVLGSRTLPLIRYELDDAATMTDAPCPCGRRSPRLLHVADQPRALLRLPGAAGAPVDVHPVVVTSVLDAAPVRAWQVVHGPTHLRVLVVQPASSFSATGIATALRDGLSAAGAAAVPVEVAVVDELRRGASGKASLVISEPGAPSPTAP